MTSYDGDFKMLREYGFRGAKEHPRLRFSRDDKIIDGAPTAQKIILQFVDPSIVSCAIKLKEEDKAFDGVWFNSTTCNEYDPFFFETGDAGNNCDQDSRGENSIFVLDAVWFRKQPLDLQTSIHDFINSQEGVTLKLCDNLEYPHQKTRMNCRISDYICAAYRDHFTFDKFSHLVDPPPFLVHLSSLDRTELLEKARIGCLTGKEFEQHHLDDFSNVMVESIQNYCQRYPGGVFAKTLEKSAKNDTTLRPLHEPLEIIQQLTSSRDVLCNLEHKVTSKLVLMPWNSKISKMNEFRLFVHDSRLVALSQQQWYRSVEITEEMAIIAAKAACEFVQNIVEGVKWPDIVIDAWIDYDNKKWHLIEINPGGISMSSGSSLFEWKVDAKILEPDGNEQNDIYVRIHDPL
eukprot:CAMPEP_0203670166 /NCGR_PEP_ID=MMETSP0090-20130426/6334_1 /ASSEMBLY_ACC=CAM_ASM_001088 /TAXON_ID=426623 /ORGANISM="Chaetoceros affinis, Strain CCMP159" /LENGTH=403 /DNA_ID=CAMNT_0050534979 /DNA_START=13 /DNA_END=1224 /DNA_ORIENTATION=+